MTLFFDLDGTLIDSRQRLYKLFQHLVEESHLTFDDYWALKRNKIDHREILVRYFNYSQIEFDYFEKNWMTLIESSEYLTFDQPFDGVKEYLNALLCYDVELYLVTARQFKSGVSKQLSEFGWEGLFKGVLVTEQQKSKADLMKNFIDYKNVNWIIGDTGTDITIGKSLGINTMAVLSGFLSKKFLMEYNPDLVCESVTNFWPTDNLNQL
jgi:phosphoglycolate phosphatase